MALVLAGVSVVWSGAVWLAVTELIYWGRITVVHAFLR
jgi:hypothetical protein